MVVATLSRNRWSWEMTTTGPEKSFRNNLEPSDGEDVQVVRGLVQEKDVGLAGQHLGQEHPEFEATREGGQGVVVKLGRNAQPLQNRPCPCLGGVAVVVLNDLLHLGEPMRVEVRLGSGQDPSPAPPKRARG